MILFLSFTFRFLRSERRRGGWSHVKAYRDVLSKWVSFRQNKGPILVKKSLEEGPTSPKLQNNVFEVKEALEMGPDLRKFQGKIVKSAIFEEGKSLEMGKGFRPLLKSENCL